jgi:hypothetical protein
MPLFFVHAHACYHQRHIRRDRQPSTTACPACRAMRTNKLKQCMEKKNYFFCTGRLEVPRQDTNLLYRHDKPNETTKEGPLLYVLFESPFILVSTVSRDHPSLISLVTTPSRAQECCAQAGPCPLHPDSR